MLTRMGVEPRTFFALARVMILRDLRGQHYAVATGAKAQQVLSPLFLVAGQCLTASVLTCALLFARVEVFFFVFVNLCLGFLLLASAILVEFQEVIFDPDDRKILGHRPISNRTYAAAKFTNLLFYFLLIYCSLNVFPLIIGAGLRDAGPWYFPAYFLVSFCGSFILLVVLVFGLLAMGRSEQLLGLRRLLSWAQIVSILVVFYGGQLILRDGTAALQVWGAFPPEWIRYLPPTWLSWFVERASYSPDRGTLAWAVVLAGVSTLLFLAAVIRLSRLYADVQPVEAAVPPSRPMAPGQIGGLSGWLGRTSEERVGYWMCLTFLRRDGGLAMRCLLAFNLALVALVAGVAIGPFGNPCRDADTAENLLAVMAVFLIPMAAPALIHNLTYARDSAGGWLLRAAPVADPLGLVLGSVRAVYFWVVLPLCLLMGTTAAAIWNDPLAGVLHAALAAGLTWLVLLASLWLVSRAWPFSLPPARGSALALPPLPTFALSVALLTVAGVHALLAQFPLYWLAIFAAMPLIGWWLRGRAAVRVTALGAAAR